MRGLIVLNRDDDRDNMRSGMREHDYEDVRSQMRSHYRTSQRGHYRTGEHGEMSEELCEAYKKGYKHGMEDMEKMYREQGGDQDGYRRYGH